MVFVTFITKYLVITKILVIFDVLIRKLKLMSKTYILVLTYIVCFCWLPIGAQQTVDTTLIPMFQEPYHKLHGGPKVFIDELHNNLHTLNGKYKPFSLLLQNDGYRVKPLVSIDEPGNNDIMVISNPIHSKNIGNWNRPIYDAFNQREINRITQWVRNGGRLLLIADHMPFAGATNSLAQAFGFEFCDGFAQLDKANDLPDVFSEKNERLIKTEITDGTIGKPLNSVSTFTGSSFQIPLKAVGILKFKNGDSCLQPDVAWQFDEHTISKNLADSYQGAILEFGKGKIAVFGEAAQFTNQTVTNENGTFQVGFNSSFAPNNIDFLRNIMLWLSR